MTDRTKRLEKAQQRLREIDERLADLQLDRELARREIELLGEHSRPRASRTDRVLEVLGRVGAATPAQVRDQLQLEEPEVGSATVRTTLTYLLDQGKVCRPGLGGVSTGWSTAEGTDAA